MIRIRSETQIKTRLTPIAPAPRYIQLFGERRESSELETSLEHGLATSVVVSDVWFPVDVGRGDGKSVVWTGVGKGDTLGSGVGNVVGSAVGTGTGKELGFGVVVGSEDGCSVGSGVGSELVGTCEG